MEQTISNQEQRLQMLNRKKIELTGVMEVISFDTQEVVLDTVEGQLRLEGEDLHDKKLVLERGEVEIQGKVRELAYKSLRSKAHPAAGLEGSFADGKSPWPVVVWDSRFLCGDPGAFFL